VTSCNGGMLWLNTMRHDDDADDDNNVNVSVIVIR